MIYQNELDENISHIACYYTAIAYYREKYQSYIWTADELNTKFNLAKMAGYIDKNDCIYSPNGVIRLLGCRLRFQGKYYPESFIPDVNKFVIGCWKLTRDSKSAHFVVMDGSGKYRKENVIFDPWKGGSNTVANGICTSLRAFQRL